MLIASDTVGSAIILGEGSSALRDVVLIRALEPSQQRDVIHHLLDLLLRAQPSNHIEILEYLRAHAPDVRTDVLNDARLNGLLVINAF